MGWFKDIIDPLGDAFVPGWSTVSSIVDTFSGKKKSTKSKVADAIRQFPTWKTGTEAAAKMYADRNYRAMYPGGRTPEEAAAFGKMEDEAVESRNRRSKANRTRRARVEDELTPWDRDWET